MDEEPKSRPYRGPQEAQAAKLQETEEQALSDFGVAGAGAATDAGGVPLVRPQCGEHQGSARRNLLLGVRLQKEGGATVDTHSSVVGVN